jgi:site-specific DNA-methyltransferase (adenine-specific)
MSYQLIHGDCLDVLPTLDAGSIDAVITDPPYGIKHRRGKAGNRGKGITRGTIGIIGDSQPFDPSPWLSFPVVLLWGANWYADKLQPGRWLIWDKQEHGGSGDFSEAEIAWCNQGRALKIFRHMWLGVQRASEVGQKRLHDTQKPVALMEWCLQVAGVPQGATVLDPYMGSGTTGVACLNTGRRFIGIEKDASCFAIAQERLAVASSQLRMAV